MKAVSVLVMVHRYPWISVKGVCCTSQAFALGTGAAASGVHLLELSKTLRLEGLEHLRWWLGLQGRGGQH